MSELAADTLPFLCPSCGEKSEPTGTDVCAACAEKRRAAVARHREEGRRWYKSGETKLCRHCQQKRVARPLGLCWKCYYLPGVRQLYPSTSKFGRRGHGTGGRQRYPLPAEPTTAEPGSEAKVAVLCERARRRESLFHPLDVRIRPGVRFGGLAAAFVDRAAESEA